MPKRGEEKEKRGLKKLRTIRKPKRPSRENSLTRHCVSLCLEGQAACAEGGRLTNYFYRVSLFLERGRRWGTERAEGQMPVGYRVGKEKITKKAEGEGSSSSPQWSLAGSLMERRREDLAGSGRCTKKQKGENT